MVITTRNTIENSLEPGINPYFSVGEGYYNFMTVTNHVTGLCILYDTKVCKVHRYNYIINGMNSFMW